jgi:hypothetical protein
MPTPDQTSRTRRSGPSCASSSVIRRLPKSSGLHRLSTARLSRRDPGRTAVRFAGDAASLRTWIARTLIETPGDLMMLAGVWTGLALIEPWLALAAGGAALLCVPLMLWTDPRVRRLTRQARSAQARVTGDVVRLLRDARPVRRAGLGPRVRRDGGRALRQVTALLVRRAWFEATLRSAVMAAATGAVVLVTVLGAWLLSRGVISPGELVSATWLTGLMSPPMNQLAGAWLMHGRAAVARVRIDALLRQPAEPAGDRPGLRAPVRLRLNMLVLPGARGPGPGARGPAASRFDALARAPEVVQMTAAREECAALVAVLLRESKPADGRAGLNGRGVRRYPRPVLRRAVWHVDEAGYAALAALRPGASLGGLDPSAIPADDRLRLGVLAGLDRGCPLLLIDVPEGTAGSTPRVWLRSWLQQRRDPALVVLLGGPPLPAIRQLTAQLPVHTPHG